MSKVETFVLEADEHEQLVLAIRILQRWHRGVSHYVTGKDINGAPYLSLLWTNHATATPLMSRLNDPDAIALQVSAWLKEVDYGHEPDHDGSNKKGFRITSEGPQLYAGENSYHRRCEWNFYTFMTVQPFWNEYHQVKRVITVDSLIEVIRLEAKVSGANYWQLKAIYQLEALVGRQEEFNPYRKAELDVQVADGRMNVVISEADSSGVIVANGEWTRMTFDVHGSISMTTSHDPERIEVLPAPS